ncbi:hypothetical protein AK812_SmicGene5183 [Symbiodinium microadriaticum]|uniref:Uncharacterized protein n=1 Tax=Symbiodinium microadriaticum TaxID=2951 RepID=A0A1Q9EUF2_SYMMI|nr:hypothetical protein AK812_SmicGene5183 [Symbiodinium microadriaticum]
MFGSSMIDRLAAFGHDDLEEAVQGQKVAQNAYAQKEAGLWVWLRQEAEAAGRGSRGLFLEEMWALELRDELTSLWNQRGRVTAAMGWILQTQEQQEAEMRLAQKAGRCTGKGGDPEIKLSDLDPEIKPSDLLAGVRPLLGGPFPVPALRSWPRCATTRSADSMNRNENYNIRERMANRFEAVEALKLAEPAGLQSR